MSDQTKKNIVVIPAAPATTEEGAETSIEVLEPAELDDVAGGSGNGVCGNIRCLEKDAV